MQCQDCLEHMREGDGFVVLKRRIEDDAEVDDGAALDLGRFAPVVVCMDCAGWYDDPVPVSE